MVLDSTDMGDLIETIHSGRGDNLFLAYANAMVAKALLRPGLGCDSCAPLRAADKLRSGDTTIEALKQTITSRTALMAKTYRRQNSACKQQRDES